MRSVWNDSHELATLFSAAQCQVFFMYSSAHTTRIYLYTDSIIRSVASARRALTPYWYELTVVPFQQSQILSLKILPSQEPIQLAHSDTTVSE